jgi:hypothetical protein
MDEFLLEHTHVSLGMFQFGDVGPHLARPVSDHLLEPLRVIHRIAL